MSLSDAAVDIVEENRNAGHPSRTILVALIYVEEEGVNAATRELREMKEKGAPPRWLVQRWANYAFSTNNTPKGTS